MYNMSMNKIFRKGLYLYFKKSRREYEKEENFTFLNLECNKVNFRLIIEIIASFIGKLYALFLFFKKTVTQHKYFQDYVFELLTKAFLDVQIFSGLKSI